MAATRLPLSEAQRKAYEKEKAQLRDELVEAEMAVEEAQGRLSEIEKALKEGLETQENAETRERIERRKLEGRMVEIREKGW